jgi:hypothetical protein
VYSDPGTARLSRERSFSKRASRSGELTLCLERRRVRRYACSGCGRRPNRLRDATDRTWDESAVIGRRLPLAIAPPVPADRRRMKAPLMPRGGASHPDAPLATIPALRLRALRARHAIPAIVRCAHEAGIHHAAAGRTRDRRARVFRRPTAARAAPRPALARDAAGRPWSVDTS